MLGDGLMQEGRQNVPAELLEEHEATSGDKSAEVGGDGEQIFDGLARRDLLIQSLDRIDTVLDRQHLVRNLFFSALRVDLAQDCDTLFTLTMCHKLTRRFGTEKQEDSEDDGWYGTETDHIPPSVCDFVEGGVECVCQY